MTCVLCGTNQNLELRTKDNFEVTLRQRYVEGPFAWVNFTKTKMSVLHVCVHCLNHVRKRRFSKKKHMLLMDQYLLGLMNPGMMNFIDMRSKKRLRRVLQETSNPYSQTFCAPLALLLHSQHPIQTWWKINLKSMFFHDYMTARVVRQHHKIQDSQAHAIRDQKCSRH